MKSRASTGDLGYPVDPYLLTPFTRPETLPQQEYNRSQTRTRVITEQTIGLFNKMANTEDNSTETEKNSSST